MLVGLLRRRCISAVLSALVSFSSFLGILILYSFLPSDWVEAHEQEATRSGRPVSGRVFSVRDGKPLVGVRVTLAGQSSTTNVSGRFLFAQPPSGYQLITLDHASLEGFRRPLKDGSPGGLMHADPVFVKVSGEQAIDLTDPIWVVQTLPATYAITPGERARCPAQPGAGLHARHSERHDHYGR